MKRRQTFTINEDLLRKIEEFRRRNRVPSLSKALEQLLTKSTAERVQSTGHVTETRVEFERKLNNDTYREIKSKLEQSESGKFAVIAMGKLQGNAASLESAFKLLRSSAPAAKHAIIQKVGERTETDAVWEGIGEEIS